MKDDTVLKAVGITAITAMEITAMVSMHIDGAMLSTAVGVVAGIVGYQIGKNGK